MNNETISLEIKPSKIHYFILVLIALLSLIAVFISAFSMGILFLFVFIGLLFWLSLKKIQHNRVTKLILQKNKQQIFFINDSTITTEKLTYTYLSNYLTVLRYNKMSLVLFQDSCVTHSLINFNIFLKTNAFCRR